MIGIACPQCGSSRLRVTTVRRRSGVIVRYRRCRKCRAKVVTEERPRKTKVLPIVPTPPILP